MIFRAAILLVMGGVTAGAVDFIHDVQPILAEACYQCHGSKRQKGHLRLDSFEGMFLGGKNGTSIVPGDPLKSSLFIRVSLPPGDDEFMPVKGDPLNKAQLEIIETWIKEGARASAAALPAQNTTPAEKTNTDAKVPEKSAQNAPPPVVTPSPSSPETFQTLPPLAQTELDILSQNVKLPDAHALHELSKTTVWWRPVSQNGSLLELDFRQIKGPVTAEQLQPLTAFSANIVWLDFAGTGITDRDLAHLRQLTKLQSLHLERTAIDDKGLKELSALTELRYLNLYDTKITDAGLQSLYPLTKLQNVYLWQTQVTALGAEQLKKIIPGVSVILADELPEPAAMDGGPEKRKKKGKK